MAKPLTDTSTPEKWKAHQDKLAAQRLAALPDLVWKISRVVAQDFTVIAKTREEAIAIIDDGLWADRSNVESMRVESFIDDGLWADRSNDQ